MNGKSELDAIKIDPEAFNPEDIEELETMILAAVRDAQRQVNDEQQRLATNITGGIKIPGLF